MNGIYSESALRDRGEQLGRSLPPGSVVFLEGDLGAGKTTLVQSIARGLGVTASATSPTYSLVHQYQGRRGPVFHLDCYRLRTPHEAADLDWETLLRDGDAVLIEWPERAGDYLPAPLVRCRLEHVEQDDLRWLAIEQRQSGVTAP
ncbi:MAG: tRNA (adenosine(37)-N6)-threonylcarbamoyltransferase complex ATPase subunit type 1 TsaE [Gemmatimonadota bacterium]